MLFSSRAAFLVSFASLLLAGVASAQPQPSSWWDDIRQKFQSRRGATEGDAAAGSGASTARSALTDGGSPVRVEKVFGDKVGFRPGRDNLGFANLSGAVQLGGMAGNCYTMAFVSKLFFERARYVPSNREEAEKRGFGLDELAGSISGGGAPTLEVKDFESLLDLSYDEGFGETEAFAEIARNRGLDDRSLKGSSFVSGRRKMIVQLVQIISTIHYLHYMQYQAGSFLEAILRQKMTGNAAVRAVTVREVQSMIGRLAQGKPALLLMLNVGQVYGHVVLAYKITRSATADYIEVYDSNVQHGKETRPSILKIGRDGQVLGYFRQEEDGKLQPHSIYDNSTWFSDRERLAIMDLPDFTLSPENMRALAQKLRVADKETAFLMAGGQLLRNLTESPPETTTLQAATLQFLRDAEAIEGKPAAERLPKNASPAAINKFLAAHTDKAIRTAFPYALPQGVSLTDTQVRLDPRDPNKAEIHTILTLEKDGPVHHLAGVVHSSAALSGYRALAEWVEDTRNNVGPTKIRVEVDIGLTKQRMPSGFKTEFGLFPTVRKSHVVLGDISPSVRLAAAHQMEVSKPTLQGGLKTAVGRIGFIGTKYEFEYMLLPATFSPVVLGRQVQLTPEIRRKGWARIDGVDLDLVGPPTSGGVGKMRVKMRSSAFLAINPITPYLGVSGTADPIDIDVQLYTYAHLPAAQWIAFVEANGKMKFDDGVFNLLSGAVTRFADRLFPFVRGRVNEYIKGSLNSYVKLVRPIEIASASVSTKSLALKTNEAIFDVEQLARQLFHFDSPVAIRNFKVATDRVVIGIDPK